MTIKQLKVANDVITAAARKSRHRFQCALVVIDESLDALVSELMFQIEALP